MSDRLAEVERPLAHLLEPTRQSLWVRAYGTPALHRLVPTRAALGLAALRGRLEARLLARRREQARAELELLLGTAPDDGVVRQRIVDEAVRAELQWRPWIQRRLPVEGGEHLDRARAAGRGVILVTAHIGPFLAIVHTLAARGAKLYVSGGHRVGEPGLDGRQGRWTVAQNRWVEAAGCRWVRQPGSYDVLRELLLRGEVVWIAGDARGRTETTLVGRRVRVGSGLGRLAAETGAAVVPVFALRRGNGHVVEIHPPLESSADPQAVTDELARVIGAVALAYPEQVHDALLRVLS